MPSYHSMALLALAAAAFGQAPAEPAPELKCRLCGGTSAKDLPRFVPKPLGRAFVVSPGPERRLPEPTIRNSPCSVPLVNVPLDAHAVPLVPVRPPAPNARMPQFQGPAPPCQEPAAR